MVNENPLRKQTLRKTPDGKTKCSPNSFPQFYRFLALFRSVKFWSVKYTKNLKNNWRHILFKLLQPKE